jgi:hypothetical protein
MTFNINGVIGVVGDISVGVHETRYSFCSKITVRNITFRGESVSESKGLIRDHRFLCLEL